MSTTATKPNWTKVTLAEIAEIERSAVSPDKIRSGTTYVGLENITSDGGFVNVSKVTNGELASTKFCFTPLHILYGKLRPYLAKIACPDFEGVCSTDILPILPGPNVDQGFLLHFLRQPHMIAYASSRTSGANLPRLSPSELAAFEVPLPPLSEQKRIADILDKADGIRRKRVNALEPLARVRQSALHDVLLRSDQKDRWPERQIRDIAIVQGGLALSARRDDLPRKAPYLRVANVYRESFALNEIKEIGLTDEEFNKTQLSVGDVLVVEGHGNREEVGRSAVWDGSIEDCVHQNHLIRVRPNPGLIRPIYLSAFLNSPLGRAQLFRFGKTTSGLNTISLSNVRDIQVLVPPISLQEKMETLVIGSDRLSITLRTAKEQADFLFASLVHRAFRGEL